MTIIFFIPSFYNAGGTEKILATKINYLVNLNYQITLIISDQNNKPLVFPLNSKVNVVDLKINQIGLSKLKFFGFFLNIFKLRKLYKKVLQNISANVFVVVERGYEDFIITFLGKNITTIREFHFSRNGNLYIENLLPLSKRLVKKGLRSLYEYCYKSYKYLILLTNKDKEAWSGYRNIKVIPNFTDINLFPSDYSTRPNKIIAVGSMNDDRKGIKGIIESWVRYNDSFNGWELHIYGDGKFKTTFESIANHQILENRVHFHGVIKDLNHIYNDARLLISASHAEGLPMVFLEAQAYGVPIISFDCYCGPSDIIQNGVNGQLIEIGDYNQLAKYTIKLINNKALMHNMSKNSLIVSKAFSEEKIMSSWLKLYNTKN